MKRYQTILPLAALLLTACSLSDDTRNRPEEPVALVIASDIGMVSSSVTRAKDAAWTSGDAIGVFVTPTGDKTQTVTGGSNVEYATTNLTAFIATAEPVFLPANGAAVDVYAYYPYNSNANIDATAVPISVATQTQDEGESNLPNIDFMRAKNNRTELNEPITKTDNTTHLSFQHCLSKVVFTLEAGPGMQTTDLTEAATVTLKIGGQSTTATYNIYTDTDADAISITSGSNEITAHETTKGKTYEAILLPNTSGDGGTNNPAARACTLTIGTAVYRFTIPSSKSFVAGQQTNYTLTVTATGLKVKAAIQPWGTGTTVSLTAK